MPIQIGCQTYTWQMIEGRYDGRLNHILGVASRAGYAGVEPETRFLGPLTDPVKLAEALRSQELQLPALTLVEDWILPAETEGERARADDCIELLQSFPDTILNLCPMPGMNRENLRIRQQNILTCLNAIARRAVHAGLRVGVHPNSFAGSAFRSADDYRILLDGLDAGYAGYIPDAGHIARGGMDPLGVIRTYLDRVVHVHFKDMTTGGAWAPMGEGVIDFVGITKFLIEENYHGWLVVEDECEAAEVDPDKVALADGKYMGATIAPIIDKSTERPGS